jgi:hypothetical protein
MWPVRQGGSSNPKGGAGQERRKSGFAIQWAQRTRATVDRMRIRFRVYPDKMFKNKHSIRTSRKTKPSFFNTGLGLVKRSRSALR